MSTKKKMLQAAAGAAGGVELLAIEDVFSTYLYTGQSAFSVVNGIDMETHGGAVWIKNRNSVRDHRLFSTGLTNLGYYLAPNLTSGEVNLSTQGITSFNSDGWSVGTGNSETNNTGFGFYYTSWTFRKAPRFFDVVTYTGDGTGNKSVPHNLGVAPGFYTAKTTAIADNWFSYHRSLGATKYVNINSTGAAQTNSNIWGDTEPTDTHFTIGTGLNVSGRTYVIYLFAHDPLGPSGDGSDGLIACGSFTTDGSGNATVDLGWEPQWVLRKNSGTGGSWSLYDNMRGLGAGSGTGSLLLPNSTIAEIPGTSDTQINSTGIDFSTGENNNTYIYIAIRRGPMRAPESGTEVLTLNARTGTGADFTTTGIGFAQDAILTANRSYAGDWKAFFDRLRGDRNYLLTHSSSAESGSTQGYEFGNATGTAFLDHSVRFNRSGETHIDYFLRRAPGFFDVVAYNAASGDLTVPHNLGVTPEMIVIKGRNYTTNWTIWHSGLTAGTSVTNYHVSLNNTNAETGPDSDIVSYTDTDFVVGNARTATNNTIVSGRYIAYLFATLPGVSKVGSYTGNGTNQTINCGFTSGARFVLIKRTDSTGDWYVWDTARGIVAANDPHLSLNTTAAEVTTDDTIDPDSSGFIVNQDAATNVNVSSATYIFLAIA